ncbi:molecular chaperone [Enterobacter cloacae]|uniref:fimbrial biogenesis chaperone n=1 Tax=Enterobacter cloacae TaxID=550 RepID=UPI000BA84967|nr:molecular chaperone [Enterobacter cloacae]PAN94641.1 molecular chaperone [Enterobacter cloacae]HAS1065190.1 molecular chaperone [Enterobacter cloacae]HAS1098101.1 molecular chaperone [Enterobacter cloacae]
MSAIAKTILVMSVIASATSAHAAIALDRTRAIYPGDQKSISLTITNENKSRPYLAQSWLENAKGDKITTPFNVMPPLQRVEPGKKSQVRISDVASSTLPQDRESVYWLNVREVPPKSEKSNVIQVALQTRIKFFYRPAEIIPDRFSRWDDQLILRPVSGGYEIENPTPYYMTVVAITGGEKEVVDKSFRAVMIEPKSTMTVKSKSFATPYVTTINDFGGKPRIPFRCSDGICKGFIPEKTY